MAKKKSGFRRTKKGNVKASTRKKFGSKGGPNKRGSFPIGDRKSAIAAIRLRGHAKSRKSVLNRAAKWASKHNDKSVKAAVEKARAKDKAR